MKNLYKAIFNPKPDNYQLPNCRVMDLKKGDIYEYIEDPPGARYLFDKGYLYFVKRDLDGKLTPIEHPEETQQEPKELFIDLTDPPSGRFFAQADELWTPGKLTGLFICLGIGLFVLFLLIVMVAGAE